MVPWEELTELDGLLLAVPHRELLQRSPAGLVAPLRHGGVFFDIKSAVDRHAVRSDIQYWSL
jgi:UDP-N-acetyl-D-galactosamine dehydrogenase